ncbi:tetratricopeptide repeat protein [Oceanidesulfovibrio marinus]|uniref:Tetratricopeptide repeat-containing protein n=1 Tax=Oceanidesulfovibrio marinus TaxID=370038 RepID=A0ABX6NBN5_9BACT|nr:hypothetical protein [Oceanidesulfovibrio marinus]QJT07761.1 hypothetical protein E8L03_01920 [Oceanidesulfovibrio marinus]
MKISQKYSKLIFLGILAILVLTVYGRSLHFNFVSDDTLHITQNTHIHPITFNNLTYFWKNSYQGLYIPLSYTLLMIPASLAADGSSPTSFDPTPFHAANIVLHFANCALLFALLLSITESCAASFAGTMLFAIHPIQAESVAWISEFRGLWATLFSFLALRFYLTGVERDTIGKRYILAFVFYIMALLCKPSTTIVPLLALILEHMMYRRSILTSLRRLWPWFFAAIILTCINFSVQDPNSSMSIHSVLLRPLVALDALGFYISSLLFPTSLSFGYGRTPQVALANSLSNINIFLPLALLLILFVFRRRIGFAIYPMLLMVAALLPVLGLIPFGYQAYSTVADRYMYLAMIGPALLVALFWQHLKIVGHVSILILLSCFAALGFHQVGYWKTRDTLHIRAVEVNPESYSSLTYLAQLAFEKYKNLDLTEKLYRQAIQVSPNGIMAYAGLGKILVLKGKTKEAIHYLAIADRSKFVPSGVSYYLGYAYYKQDNNEKAIQSLDKSIRDYPSVMESWILKANLLKMMQHPNASAHTLLDALKVAPNNEKVLHELEAVTPEVDDPELLKEIDARLHTP